MQTIQAIERIDARWINDPAIQALTIPQARAVIDALSLAVYADLSIDDAEAFAFNDLVFVLPCNWGEIVELNEYALMSVRTAALLSNPTAIRGHIGEISAQLPEAVHGQVFAMLLAITVADKKIQPGEAELLSWFSEALGLSEEEAEAIYHDTLDALGLTEGPA